MKILNYIVVLVAIALSGVAYAAEPVVTTNIDNGVLSVNVQMSVDDPAMTSEDAIKVAVEKALNAIGMDSVAGKAVNAAIAAVKSAISDKSSAAKGNVNIAFQIKQRVENGNPVADVKTIVDVSGTKYEGNTSTVFAADNTAKTNGNVVKTDNNGATTALPVNLVASNNGTITGNVGSSSVAVESTDAATAEAAQALTQTASAKEANNGGIPVPDNTIVTSGSRK